MQPVYDQTVASTLRLTWIVLLGTIIHLYHFLRTSNPKPNRRHVIVGSGPALESHLPTCVIQPRISNADLIWNRPPNSWKQDPKYQTTWNVALWVNGTGGS